MSSQYSLENSGRYDPVGLADPPVSAPPKPRSRLAYAIAWMAAASWSTQLVCWVCTMMVARTLGPDSFGLIGMANCFLIFAAIVNEFGMSAAIVAMPELNDKQVRQLNTVSVGVGIAVFALACAAAYPLGVFFRAPALPPVVIAMSIALVVGGFRNVPDGLLKRDFQFKFLAAARGTETLVYGGVIVLATFSGAGYWSLVLGGVLAPTVSCIMILFKRRAGFAWPQYRSIRSALVLSGHILANRLGGYGYSNADSLIAGRMLGQSALGAYNLAFTLANLPVQRISDQITSVLPAYLANVQNDKAALRDYVLKVTEGLLFLIVPLSLGLLVVAPDLVLALLGPKWVASILPLRILSLYIATCSAASVFIPLLTVIGDSRYVMWNNLAATAYLPIAFYIGSNWGTAGIAMMWPILYPAIAVPLYVRAFKRIEMDWRTYLSSVFPAISASCIMVGGVLLTRHLLPETVSVYERLAIEVLAGAVVYYVALALLHRQHLRRLYGLLRPVPASQ